ncbi:hypothetical protein N9062_01795 [Akkermansiaceae bacterium]|nr:hypothetical protein [bacterium]MDA7891041.1 hypothetical protein [Akkermansiaceae bacterium]MDA7886880.1 hypothetical protein [bacterium]MDA7933727.1 hypothetical protein [Akkermansiaceae bacterium]MDB4509715.1 hypothetical protein [Akkermansiaceae bacterium]
MAHQVTSKEIPINGEHLEKGKIATLQMICGGIGGLGLIASIIYLIVGSGQAHGSYAFSWLFAVFFITTIVLGGCFWTFLHNLSNSGWGTSVRRLMENLGFVFPFLVVFFIPFLFPNVQQYLYEWMTAYRDVVPDDSSAAEAKTALLHDSDPHNHLLAAKTFYLNPTFWYIRFAFYFIGLGFFITLVRKFSIAQDTDDKPGTKNLFAARKHSSWSMIIFGVTLTFLALDFVMALDYSWFSTMFGVYVFAGSALNSMAVLILTGIFLQKMGYLKNVVTQEHYHIMGKLCFAFTVFWAYVSFSQFFLIWYANITEETRYFLLRNTENWNILSLMLVFMHFGLPFLALLRSDVKKSAKFMTIFCFYILFMHVLDVYHMIIPERGPSVGLVIDHHPQLWISGSWLGDILALVIAVCAFLFLYLRNLTSAALYPHRDPRILESANLHN